MRDLRQAVARAVDVRTSRPALPATLLSRGNAKATATLDERAGAALDGASRTHFERRFDHDFSQVRVHAGPAAAKAARALDARAFTHDRDIYFGAGEYAPGSPAGRRLLGHELAHVVQRDAGEAEDGRAAEPAVVDAGRGELANERDADRMAAVAEESTPTQPARPRPAVRHAPANVIRRRTAGRTPTTEHVAGTLYARAPDGTPLPPSLEDIAQGGLNDCFLMGALAAIVSSDPIRIRTMIAYGPNNTYTVTFKGIGFWSSARQTVTADFALNKHARLGPRRALWPLVIEQAYVQEKGGLDVVDKGGDAASAVEDMMNDGPSRFDPREKTADYIMGKVAKGRQKKWPMTVASPKQEDAGADKRAMTTTIPGLHFWHTYAIVDVDARTNRIKLFNPWGQSHPNGSGWIAVDDVRKFFVEVAIND